MHGYRPNGVSVATQADSIWTDLRSGERGHNFVWLNSIWALVPALLVLVNILSGAKLVEIDLPGLLGFSWLGIPPVILAGGTVIFPITYVLDDMITEVYGFKYATRIILSCFVALLLSFAAVVFVQALPAPSFMDPASAHEQQMAYERVLGLVPRVNFASIVAIVFGRLVNSSVMAWMKARTGKRSMKTRFIVSTIAGEAVDTSLFLGIAFLGTTAPSELLALCVSQYLFKVAWEVGAMPFTTYAVRKLKRIENVQ